MSRTSLLSSERFRERRKERERTSKQENFLRVGGNDVNRKNCKNDLKNRHYHLKKVEMSIKRKRSERKKETNRSTMGQICEASRRKDKRGKKNNNIHPTPLKNKNLGKYCTSTKKKETDLKPVEKTLKQMLSAPVFDSPPETTLSSPPKQKKKEKKEEEKKKETQNQIFCSPLLPLLPPYSTETKQKAPPNSSTLPPKPTSPIQHNFPAHTQTIYQG